MAVAEMPVVSKKFLSEDDLSAKLGIAKQTLSNWRHTRLAGPPFVRVGRLIRYDSDAVQAWLEENTVTPSKAD